MTTKFKAALKIIPKYTLLYSVDKYFMWKDDLDYCVVKCL